MKKWTAEAKGGQGQGRAQDTWEVCGGAGPIGCARRKSYIYNRWGLAFVTVRFSCKTLPRHQFGVCELWSCDLGRI